MPYKHKIPIYTENLNLTGAYFRHQRIIDGLSLTYVADSIRMNKGFLSDLENGKRNFPDGTINQLNDFYNLKFDDSLKFYIELENNIDEIFHALCNSNTFKEKQLLELILSKRDIYENSSGFFLFNLLNLFYLIRFNCNETFINDAKKLIESNLDAINSKDLSIFYCILGIYYKRNPSTNFVAEKYFKKCLSLSSNIPDIAALCTFELISIYAETNRSALAYTYCEKSRSIFNRLQNYTTMFFIDFFQCNCLTNLGLYENSIQKLTELLNNIDQSSNKYISTIYHSLAWCYLLDCQYSECIKYTNLAIENKDPSCALCYFIPYSYYKQNEYLKCLDYIESHLEYADDFYKPFLQAISARIQKQNVDFEKNIILYYQSLLQNNVYEDIPLIQNFILDYYTETNNKDMMIKILIDIKSFNDKDLTLKSSTLFVDSSN